MSLLPVDLLALPFVLILLALMPSTMALSIAGALLIPILIRLHYEGTLVARLPGLVRLGALMGCYLLSTSYLIECSGCHLSSQLVWLGWFCASRILHYIYKRVYGSRLANIIESECCCSARRRAALLSAYRRNDRILIRFACITLAVALPLTYWAEDHGMVDRILSVSIALISLGIIALEMAYLVWTKRHLDNEYWIPIYSDEGQVLGRVPATLPHSEVGRLPVVRLVAYSQGMIYLEQGMGQTEAIRRYDTPFHSWLGEQSSPEQIAQWMIDERFCGIKRAKPRELLRYHHQEGEQSLLVFLFAVEVESPDLLQIDCRPIEGKWCPIAELAPQVGQPSFSPYLCAELPLLEQTVLLAQRIRQRSSVTHRPREGALT